MMGEDFICHSNTENYFFNENSTLAFYELFRKLQNKFDCSYMFFYFNNLTWISIFDAFNIILFFYSKKTSILIELNKK